MKLKVINIDGKKVQDIEISDKIFSLKPNKEMIKLLIDWQLNHFKPRTAKTKQRGEIKVLQLRFMLKKELVVHVMLVEKHQYL